VADKPKTAAEYRPEMVEVVRSTCLQVAVVLGDLMDEVTIVGGLVPTLLVPQGGRAGKAASLEGPLGTTWTGVLGPDLHPGTMDLDVGLSLGILDQKRYQGLVEKLRRAGFERDTNEQGKPTGQRWRMKGARTATVDFLIPPSASGEAGGTLKNIESDFAAIFTPGLGLAFRDRQQVRLSGRTLRDEQAARDIWVCGPGAYVVLKALACDGREEDKDAYDLFYVLQHYGRGVEDVAHRFVPLLADPDATRAVEILRRDFLGHDHVGPLRAARFLYGRPDENLQADVVSVVRELLRQCEIPER
jgi:hypothetical protein